MKIVIKSLLILASIIVVSCTTSSSNATSTGVNQSLISGWWYRGLNAPVYKAYYFGSDGSYKQDQSNYGLGMGIGTWVWETSTKLKMTPTPGGGIVGGAVELELTKLTNDSLVGIGGGTLRLSRINHE